MSAWTVVTPSGWRRSRRNPRLALVPARSFEETSAFQQGIELPLRHGAHATSGFDPEKDLLTPGGRAPAPRSNGNRGRAPANMIDDGLREKVVRPVRTCSLNFGAACPTRVSARSRYQFVREEFARPSSSTSSLSRRRGSPVRIPSRYRSRFASRIVTSCAFEITIGPVAP